MALRTFAFVHAISEAQLRPFRAAFPGIEFLMPEDHGLPQGLERAEGAAIAWDSPPIDAILDAAPALQWIHQRGAGIDRIATPRLAASGLLLTNGSGNHAINIAEHVMGLMLAFARRLPALLETQRERRWKPPPVKSLFELCGQTLVIVGFGAIGSALAQRARAFGMTVIGVRRTAAGPSREGAERVVAMSGLDAVLADADHVVLAAPLTAETHGLFSTARFKVMKRGAYLCNVGRGAIVDHDALLAALRAGQLAGAGLDVTEPEPLPAESPLWTEPNVIVTAHSSGLTPHSFERYQALLLENLGRFVRGEPLLNVVDVQRGY
ncbi:MAG TPA: D-2-hydroxyacid dehydrogenase [Caldimonas sp.]|jgi:phosphoglycerate dehydrogenase-like enzyme|nr:D-2-hydroxyacid dehydrogenase [Caldimonas sp.]HEX2540262.1 D-2-hydroxyacid dehydrogenase [Caldimonas sp.]